MQILQHGLILPIVQLALYPHEADAVRRRALRVLGDVMRGVSRIPLCLAMLYLARASP